MRTLDRRKLLGLSGLLCLGGCTGFGLSAASQPISAYSLDDLAGSTHSAGRAEALPGPGLLIATAPVALLYDTDRMVFTRDGAAYAYYQFANWSDRPARRISQLAEARLSQRGRFASVGSTTSGLRGERLLSLRLEWLLHDDSRSPGEVRLAVTGEMIDTRTRTLLGRERFEAQARVRSRDAQGAAQAGSEALTTLLNALCDWTENRGGSVAATAARPRPPEPVAIRAPAPPPPDRV